MMPGGGGMYLYLREAYSPLWGFLYGWTLFTVIQTGTIAAVAVAFARFLGVLAPSVSESHYLVAPLHLSAHYALTLSTAQLVALLVIALLTATNTLGIEYAKIIQNSFTVAKLGALGALILLGLTVGWNPRQCTPTWPRFGSGRQRLIRRSSGRHPEPGDGFLRFPVGIPLRRGCVARHHLRRGRSERSQENSSPVSGHRHGDRHADLSGGKCCLPGGTGLSRDPTCSS